VVDEPPQEYRIHRDLLWHSGELSRLYSSNGASRIILRELARDKFQVFFEWSLQGRLPDRLSLAQAKEAMKFALDYDVPILQNRLADWFHKKILDGTWKLDLETVRWVYSTIPADTGLRDLFALSLYTTPTPPKVTFGLRFEGRGMRRKHPVADEWRELSCEYFDLGADFVALRFTPDAEAILKETADTCQFHNHGPYKGGGCLTLGVLWRARKSVEEALAGEAPAPPAEESLTEEPPAEEAPPAEDYPAVEPPAEEAPPAEDYPAVEPPVEEAPLAEDYPEVAPAEEEAPLAEDYPAEEAPAEEALAKKHWRKKQKKRRRVKDYLVVEEAPTEEAAAEEAAAEEAAAEEAPADEAPADEAPADEAAAYSAEESQAESPVEDAAPDKVSIANRTVSTLLQKRKALENMIVRKAAVYEISKMHNSPLRNRLWRELDRHLDDLDGMVEE
jgi:hypothetical protein